MARHQAKKNFELAMRTCFVWNQLDIDHNQAKQTPPIGYREILMMYLLILILHTRGTHICYTNCELGKGYFNRIVA